MADEMVRKTQSWLNSTYGANQNFEEVTVNGKTGWETIYGLRKALQIELGITNTSNAFGPTTTSKFVERFPNGVIQQNDNDKSEDNIYAIIQGGLWCKGYSTGATAITKHFYNGTGRAINKLKSNAGCSTQNTNVTLNIMKALLSMDQFRLVSGGTSEIQEIQKTLNGSYEEYIGLIPCNGLYERNMNKALIKVLQAIEGYSVADATGNFGNGTKSKLPIIPNDITISQSKKAKAIKLLRYCLCCNGYKVDYKLDSWDNELENIMKEFQNDLCISQTGIADVNTWMSLLLSKGNPDRSCIACDTIAEMTQDVLEYLKKNKYEIVGRYLTKVDGGLDKALHVGEAQRIIANEMKFFPIFQESDSRISYFTEERGKKDAHKAVKYGRINGIPRGNIIYFAVDFDATDTQITSNILPYFKGISENMESYYSVGIYGTRNVCTRIMEKEYAKTCFVSDMSTGYSGNMGFRMPKEWNFDQFNEISNISIGNKKIGLDKVAYSGKNKVVDDVYIYMNKYIKYIRQLEDYCIEYRKEKSKTYESKDIALGITNFLRSFSYGDVYWYGATLNAIDKEFVEYIKKKDLMLYNNLYDYAFSSDEHSRALVDAIGGLVDVGHLAATIEGYVAETTIPDFWLGWGGDLATLMKQVDKELTVFDSEDRYNEYAQSLIGIRSSFGFLDMCTDADAIKIAESLKSESSDHPMSNAMDKYYNGEVDLRISYYLIDLEKVNLTLSNLQEMIENKMSTGLNNKAILSVLGQVPSKKSFKACCKAFAKYIIDNYPVI